MARAQSAKQLLAVLAAVALLGAISGVAYLAQDFIQDSKLAKYWLLLISGNWSYDRPEDLGRFFHSLTALLAMALNVGNLIAVALLVVAASKIIYRLSKVQEEQEQLMRLSQINSIRDAVLREKAISLLPDVLPDDMREEVASVIKRAFVEGARDWDIIAKQTFGDDMLERLRNQQIDATPKVQAASFGR